MSDPKTNLNLNPTNEDLKGIRSPEILYIMRTIKLIQKRMKDPDIKNLEYVRVYDQLGREFDSFFNRYTGIFISVIRGENLQTLASVLYYKDQELRGLTTEAEVADKLANKYFTPAQKAASDAKLKEMKEKGEL
jgi:hypothetical protein